MKVQHILPSSAHFPSLFRAALLGAAILLSGRGASSQSAISPRVQTLYQQAHDEQASAPERAVTDYREILRLAPTLGAAYNNLGRLLYNLNRFQEASDVLTAGLRVDPSMTPAEAMLGASLLQLGNAAASLPHLHTAAGAMPDDRFVHTMLARALLEVDDLPQAATELQALTQSDPQDQVSWYLLGKVELQLSQQSLARVQQINPNSPLAHQMQGEIMESMNNTPGAITEYKKALAASSQNVAALEHLSNLYWNTGDWQHARESLTTYLSLVPGNCNAHWKLSRSLNELSAPDDDVLAQTKLAIELCPNLPEARVERARVFLRSGRAAEALPDLKAAEVIAPDETSVQALLARAYSATGDAGKAASANARFLDLQQRQHAAKERHAAEVTDANH